MREWTRTLRLRAWLAVGGLMGLVGAPLVVHAAIVGDGSAIRPAGVVAAGQMAVLAYVLVGDLRWRWLATAVAGSLVMLAYQMAARPSLIAAAALSHAGLYGMLLVLFARSLRRGQEPVATGLARRIHGMLTAERRSYTRRVTWLWCGFFAFELIGSTVLLGMGRMAWWSLFVNVADMPMVVLLFAAELGFRCWWFRGQQRGSAADMLRAFATRGTVAEPPRLS